MSVGGVNLFPQNSSFTNSYQYVDNEGSDTDIDTSNGDSISYSPAVQTADSGIQSVVQASIGSEILSKFGNGAADLQNTKTGNQLSIENGELYGVGSGSSSRVDLGSASHSGSWKRAEKDGFLSSGSAGAQQEADLKATYSSGLGAAPTVQNNLSEFGVSGSSGLTNLISSLIGASADYQQANNVGGFNPTTGGNSGNSATQSLEALIEQILSLSALDSADGGAGGNNLLSGAAGLQSFTQQALQFAQETSSSSSASGGGSTGV